MQVFHQAILGVLQIEYPSDIDEFNKILGTSEGKGSLLKDLGIILGSETKVFKNPDQTIKHIKIEESKSIKTRAAMEKKPIKKTAIKKKTVEKPVEKKDLAQINLFAGLFD